MDLRDIMHIDNDGPSFSVDTNLLEGHAKRTDIAFAPDVKWDNVQMLAIVGNLPGLKQGCYVSRNNGEWVLLAGLRTSQIPDYINNKCRRNVRYISVAGTDLEELHFNKRPFLRELWLAANPRLHYVSGFENLTGLHVLKIRQERMDSELVLSKMPELEELDLRGTELSQIRLDDPLKYLKQCDLKGAKIGKRELQDCFPALSQLKNVPLLKEDVQENRNICRHDVANPSELKLLDAIRKSCLHIQADVDYYLRKGDNGWGMEDKRNRRIRDDLELQGYAVLDQTQRGTSESGRSIGELDLLIYNDRKEPWTIIEALRVSNGAKTNWNEHLKKLLGNYNYFGAPCVYLLTYVDGGTDDFQRIWDTYLSHIPKINPGKFKYCDNSLAKQDDADGPQYIKVAKCCYAYGGQRTNAYHIFARVPEAPEEKRKSD